MDNFICCHFLFGSYATIDVRINLKHKLFQSLKITYELLASVLWFPKKHHQLLTIQTDKSISPAEINTACQMLKIFSFNLTTSSTRAQMMNYCCFQMPSQNLNNYFNIIFGIHNLPNNLQTHLRSLFRIIYWCRNRRKIRCTEAMACPVYHFQPHFFKPIAAWQQYE